MESHYTHRVVTVAVRLVVEDGLPYRAASWHLWRDHRVFVPFATIQNWVEAGGKKAEQHVTAVRVCWALLSMCWSGLARSPCNGSTGSACAASCLPGPRLTSARDADELGKTLPR